ncbi:hypothetical protein BVI434_2290008 [Burkholderia vietnamiensis]|nr:hypothetical protein BVI434_2290008 [Burkholderia vietnamiensis]
MSDPYIRNGSPSRQHGENRPACNREGLIDLEHLFHGQLAHVVQILRLKYLAAERSEDGASGRYTALWCGE